MTRSSRYASRSTYGHRRDGVGASSGRDWCSRFLPAFRRCELGVLIAPVSKLTLRTPSQRDLADGSPVKGGGEIRLAKRDRIGRGATAVAPRSFQRVLSCPCRTCRSYGTGLAFGLRVSRS